MTLRSALRTIPEIRNTSHEWKKVNLHKIFISAILAYSLEIKWSEEISSAINNASVQSFQDDKINRTARHASSSISFLIKGLIDKNKSRSLFSISVANSTAALSEDWSSLNADCEWLSNNITNSYKLLFQPLFLTKAPSIWAKSWEQLKSSLDKSDSWPWIDWFERRVRGAEAPFAIDGDNDQIESDTVISRISSASNLFFKRENKAVVSEIKAWLDEARAPVNPPVEAGNHEPALPAQNRNTLSFLRDENGRIGIDSTAQVDLLRIDTAARDRHAEAVSEARLWLDRCRGNNAAARLTKFLENYLEAAGEIVEAAKPSLLVQRGERLRQELARYDAPDNMLPPVADDLLLDGKGWQSAHNMLVGLDPVLMANDTAMLGPDRKPTLIPPEEIREKAHQVDEAGLLAEGVFEIINETADLAPSVPDPNDRQTIFSTEMAQNLFIEAFAIALNQPIAVGAVVAISAAVRFGSVAGVVGGISIMSSIKAAEYLVTHKDWILNRFGNTPTWHALIEKLANWLETKTPFEPN